MSSYAEERTKPLAVTVRRLTVDTVVGAFDATGLLVGTAGLAVLQRQQERHKGVLFGMAVAPEFHGCGIGAALVAEILEVARSMALMQVHLTVTAGNGQRASRSRLPLVGFPYLGARTPGGRGRRAADHQDAHGAHARRAHAVVTTQLERNREPVRVALLLLRPRPVRRLAMATLVTSIGDGGFTTVDGIHGPNSYSWHPSPR